MAKSKTLSQVVSNTGPLSDGIIHTSDISGLDVAYQPMLVAGTNIKTVGGSSLMGVGDISIGVSSFNTRTGAVVLGSSDVTTALGFTPVAQSAIDTSISALVASAPSTLDTLNELATALGNDANFATTVTNSIAGKLPLSGGTLTGASTVAVSTWEKWTLETTGVTAKARQGSDANGLNFTSNARWTGSAWAEDDNTKKKFAYIQHLGNGRHEFRTAATGVGVSWTTSLTVDDTAVNSSVALQQSGNQVLHAGNYSSYALPLTGGTLSNTATVSFGDADTLDRASGASRTRLQLAPPSHTGGEWTFVTYDDSANAYLRIGYNNSNYLQLRHDGNLNIAGVTLIKRNLGTNDYTNVGQHNLHLRLQRNADLKTLELGVLDNGTGIIQANEVGVGYNTLALNPVAGSVTINGNVALHAGNYGGYSTFSGKVTSGGNNGFSNDVYYGAVRNPIWNFGNATGYGLSYFQGGSGLAGIDTIGIHPNGTATGSGSVLMVTSSYTQSLGSLRAPIFYDSDNTGWYLDPASGSLLNNTTTKNLFFTGVGGDSGADQAGYSLYQEPGGWNYPYPDLVIGYHTGIKIGGYYGYNGTRIYNNNPAAGSLIASFGDGDNAFRSYDNIIAYASDRRLKENIVKIDNAVDKVLKLNGVTFDWKEMVKDLGFEPSSKHEAGVLAQEVQAVLPEAVEIAPFDYDWKMPNKSKSGESYLTVKYEKLVPLLIEAIKEQQQQIEELKRKVGIV